MRRQGLIGRGERDPGERDGSVADHIERFEKRWRSEDR